MNMKGNIRKILIEKIISKLKNKIANQMYRENFINDRKNGKIVEQIIVVKKILVSDTSSSNIPEIDRS